MKRIICVTGIILIACVITGAVVEENTSANIGQASVSSNREDALQTYILKAEGGLLTVYIKGNDTPYMTTETLISSLPQSDQDILEDGIEVQGNFNLRKALEDYCS